MGVIWQLCHNLFCGLFGQIYENLHQQEFPVYSRLFHSSNLNILKMHAGGDDKL